MQYGLYSYEDDLRAYREKAGLEIGVPTDSDYVVYFTYRMIDAFCKDKNCIFNKSFNFNFYYKFIDQLFILKNFRHQKILEGFSSIDQYHLDWLLPMFQTKQTHILTVKYFMLVNTSGKLPQSMVDLIQAVNECLSSPERNMMELGVYFTNEYKLFYQLDLLGISDQLIKKGQLELLNRFIGRASKMEENQKMTFQR